MSEVGMKKYKGSIVVEGWAENEEVFANKFYGVVGVPPDKIEEDFDLNATALRVAQEWLETLEYSFVVEDEDIPEEHRDAVYVAVYEKVRAVIND